MPNASPSAKKVFLPPSLFRFWAVLLIITLVSAIRYLWLVHVDHKQGLVVFMLPNSAEVYHRDFTLFTDNFLHFRQPGFWQVGPFGYPATTAFAFAFFYQFPHPIRVYLGVLYLLMLGGGWLWAVRLRARGISAGAAALFVIAFLASYPFRFELERANIEGIVVLFTAGAILAFFKRRYWLAATLIGIAGAMKIFPIILLGLLFSARKYKQMIWGMAAATLANLCSLWLLGPSIGIAHRQIANGMTWLLRYVESAGRGWLNRDHSLFTLVKLPLYIFGRANAAHLVHAAYPIYLASVAFSGLLLFFLVIRKLPFLNQVLILTLCAVFFPPVSCDYTFLHLSVPFALLCLCALDARNAGETDSAGLDTAMVLFGIIFSDLNFIDPHYVLMGPTRALATALLLVVLLRHPIRWPAFDQDSQAIVSSKPCSATGNENRLVASTQHQSGKEN
jgi:hypothetical protein